MYSQNNNSPNIREYTYQNGLPSRYVYDVSQTETGMMVFCTSQGLYLFDGFKFHLFLDNFPTLTSYYYRACYSAIYEYNRLYLTLEKEVICIDLNTKNIISKRAFNSALVKTFKIRDDLYSFTKRGEIHHLNKANLNSLSTIKIESFHTVIQKPNKQILLIGNSGNIYLFNGTEKEFKVHNAENKYKNINILANATGEIRGISIGNNKLIYGDSNQAINSFIKKLHRTNSGNNSDSLTNFKISQTYPDSYGNTWIIANTGVYLIPKEESKSTTIIKNRSFRGILVLKNGDIVSSSYTGLFYKKRNSNTFEKISTMLIGWSLFENPINSDEIYMLTAGNGIAIFNIKTKEIKASIAESKNIFLHGQIKINDSIYLLYGEGIHLFNIKSQQLRSIHQLQKFTSLIYSLYTLNSSEFMAGTSDGIYIINIKTGKYKKILDGECRWLEKINHTTIMAGLLGRGLYTIDIHNFESTPYIYNNLYQQSAFFPYSGKYLPQTDELIIGTGQGMFKIQIKTGITHYIKTDNIEFNTNSLTTFYKDTILAGGIAGLEMIDIHYNYNTNRATFQPILLSISRNYGNQIIESLQVHNIEQIEIQPNEIETELYFSTPMHIQKKPFLWRYRIIGLLENWVTKFNSIDQKTSIILTKIPPGNYTIEVQFQQPESGWSNIKSYQLVVIPIWYKTTYFRILLILSVFFMGALALYLLNKSKHKKQQAKQHLKELKAQLMQSELKTLRNQINPHMFANSMQTIQYFIQTKSKEEATDYVSKYSSLMRKSLDNGSSEMIYLADELQFLTIFCSLEKMRRQNNLDVTIEQDENILTNKILIPSMILQPYVENAFKHCGIPEGKDRIDINLTFKFINQNNLICSVFNSTRTLHPTVARKDVSGNEISSTRIDIYNKLLNQNGGVEFIDHEYGFECEIHIPFILEDNK